MAIAHVGYVAASGASTFTTAALDTSGADLLTVAVTEFAVAGAVLTDSKSNTWRARTELATTTPFKVIYDAKNATVGSGHTFTLTGATIFAVLQADAWSGSDLTEPFDQQNATAAAGGTMTSGFQPGSVTPTTNDQLVLSGLSWDTNGIAITSVTGMVDLQQVAFTGGNNFGGARDYVIQTTAGAINPAWNGTGLAGTSGNGVIATYKASAGGGGGTWGPLLGGENNRLVRAA